MTPEERAREAARKHGLIEEDPYFADAVAVALAFAAQERERCAKVVEDVAEAQAHGWRQNPKSHDCGGFIAASNTGLLAAAAIRNLGADQ